MAKEMKAADLIGKTVSIKGSDAKYVIKSVDGDNIVVDFYRTADAKPVTIPTLKLAMLENMVKAGTWVIEGEPDPDAVGEIVDVEEVDDIKVEGPKAAPKAETIDMKPKDEPKQEKSDKPKAKGGSRGQAPDSPQATHQGASPHDAARLRYETYTNKKGKTCAKIIGFGENDPAYVNAADLHGSATYERDKDGNKTFYLIFGPRYADAAKEVCKALTDGKPLKDCQAIVDKATEERARQRDEWKQKREERRAQTSDVSHQTSPKGKTYTEAEVADLIKRVVAGDKEAMEIVNAMSKAA